MDRSAVAGETGSDRFVTGAAMEILKFFLKDSRRTFARKMLNGTDRGHAAHVSTINFSL